MTDSDIIKALECCAIDDCRECPMQFGVACKIQVASEALTLIKYKQAEIEQLKAEYAELEAEVDKQYEQARADILGNMADGGLSCHWCIAEHKKNTIKDFAERLKARVKETAYEQPEGGDGRVCESEIVGVINEVVAEMEGENGK